MGGVFGHMSHIYDNPYMTFGQMSMMELSGQLGIKEILKPAG